MMTTMSEALRHETGIHPFHQGTGYQAFCRTCGWEGFGRELKSSAEADERRHGFEENAAPLVEWKEYFDSEGRKFLAVRHGVTLAYVYWDRSARIGTPSWKVKSLLPGFLLKNESYKYVEGAQEATEKFIAFWFDRVLKKAAQHDTDV